MRLRETKILEKLWNIWLSIWTLDCTVSVHKINVFLNLLSCIKSKCILTTKTITLLLLNTKCMNNAFTNKKLLYQNILQKQIEF